MTSEHNEPILLDSVMSEKDVIGLISELKSASNFYYGITNEGVHMDDDVFDEKLEVLKSLSVDFPKLFVEGSDGYDLMEEGGVLGLNTSDVVSNGSGSRKRASVEHLVPMLSLSKANNKDTLTSFIEKMKIQGARSFKLESKFDGFALALEYGVDDSGEYSIRTISSRGDGKMGDDYTFLSKSSDVTILGIPKIFKQLSNDKKGSNPKSFEIRGEIVLSVKQLKEVNRKRAENGQEPFKNERNGVVGLIKAAERGIGYPVELTFVSYTLISRDEGSYLNIDTLPEGFLTAGAITKDITSSSELNKNNPINLSNIQDTEKVIEEVEKYGVLKKNGLGILTDGVVIKPTNDSELLNEYGSNSHHPLTQIAYKFPGDSAPTVVQGIDYTIGRTGKVTPIARLAPVELDNGSVTVSNVTLHNFNWISERDIRVGSVVTITRANDVIPYLSGVISNPEGTIKVETPKDCPFCSDKLEYQGDIYPPKKLQCTNYFCKGRQNMVIHTSTSKGIFDFDGMAGATVEALITSGKVKDIADFFTLTEQDLADTVVGETEKGNTKLLGKTRASKIHYRIQEAKTSKGTEKFLMAMGIEFLGNRASQEIVKNYGYDIDVIMSLKESDISKLDSLGSGKASYIYNGLQCMIELVDKAKLNGYQFINPSEGDENNVDMESPISGLSFSISGSVPNGYGNRASFVKFLENNGATFHSSPKKDTSYMVGESSGSSSKAKKANELGLDFVSPEDFSSKFSVSPN